MTRLKLSSGVIPQAFQSYAALQGFDIVGFDAWLSALEQCGAKHELTERRALAVEAMLNQDAEGVLRHLEWMLLRWQQVRREEFLLPKARAAAKRSKQVSEFAKRGTAARTRYTAKHKEDWRRLASSDPDLIRLRACSARRCAEAIQKRLGLPPAAIESIRKAI